MTNVFEAGLPTINYEHAQHPDEAHAIISRARAQAPIAIGPYGPELLTYDLVRSALRDPRFRVPPGMFLAAQGITSGPLWDRIAANIVSLDGDEHRRLRRLVSKAFTPKATARLRTTIVDIITGLVDRHSARGACDVVADIARQYPIPVICALLGAPPEDWELFSDWTDDILEAFGWNAAAQTPSILTAWAALDSYLDDMPAQRRRGLTDDLISDLIRAEDDGDRLSADELRMLVAALLMAGTDTTRLQLGAAVQVLCDRPDQWALLGRHPELAISAVDELIRHSRSPSSRCAPPPKTSNWPAPKFPPARSSSSTRGRRTGIPPSATTPTVSTSAGWAPHRSRPSAAACTTASAPTSPASSWPKP